MKPGGLAVLAFSKRPKDEESESEEGGDKGMSFADAAKEVWNAVKADNREDFAEALEAVIDLKLSEE